MYILESSHFLQNLFGETDQTPLLTYLLPLIVSSIICMLLEEAFTSMHREVFTSFDSSILFSFSRRQNVLTEINNYYSNSVTWYEIFQLLSTSDPAESQTLMT